MLVGDATVGSRHAILVAFEPDGELAWAKTYGGPHYDVGTSLAALSDGDLLFGGRGSGFDHSSWYVRVDDDGALRWSKCVGSEGDTGSDVLLGVTEAPGGALLVGTTGSLDAMEAWLARVDQDGDVVWFKTLRGPALDSLEGVLRLPDGLLAWGMTDSVYPVGVGGDDRARWLARTAHDGMPLPYGAGARSFEDIGPRPISSHSLTETE